MDPLRRIGLLVGNEFAYGRGVWRGVGRYARPRRKPWLFYGVRYAVNSPGAVEYLLRCRVDGIIAHINTPDQMTRLCAWGGAVVNTSNTLANSPLPRVGVNDTEVGMRAADYLLDKGLEHFAFLGTPGMAHSAERLAGYCRRLESKGHRCLTRERPPDPGPTTSRGRPTERRELEKTLEWLHALPKPTALFARNDEVAAAASELTRQASLRVPEEVAILGADNDEIMCEFASPPLSSIKIPAERIGFEAAALLDGLMDGRAVPDHPILIPPGDVVTRQSTDVLFVGDPGLARALRFIRDHARDRINVPAVVNQAGICRSLLERRFRKALDRTPLQEIHRCRIEHAMRLLAETDETLTNVALQSGFRDVKQLHTLFRRQTGVPPSRYRRLHASRL